MTDKESFADKVRDLRSLGICAPLLDRRDEALLVRLGRASEPEAGSCPRVVCEEKMRQKMLFLARIAVYPLAFVVPPVLVGVVGVKAGLAGDGWSFARLLRPLAVGLLGLALAVLVDRFLLAPWKKRLHLGHGSTGALSSAPAKDRR